MTELCVPIPLSQRRCVDVDIPLNDQTSIKINSCTLSKIEQKLSGNRVVFLTKEKTLYTDYLNFPELQDKGEPVSLEVLALDKYLGEK